MFYTSVQFCVGCPVSFMQKKLKNFSVWTAIWLPLLLFQGPLLLETFESIIFDLIFDYC